MLPYYLCMLPLQWRNVSLGVCSLLSVLGSLPLSGHPSVCSPSVFIVLLVAIDSSRIHVMKTDLER